MSGRTTDATQPQPRSLWATRGIFLAAGIVTGGWAPLVPYIKDRLALSDASLGLALLATGGGSLLATPLAAWLQHRYGSRALVSTMAGLLALALPLLAWVPDLQALVVALFYFGACGAVYNIAINAQAVAIERQAARPLMSGFHAMYSVGGPISAASASLLLAAGVHPVLCAALVGLLVVVLAWLTSKYLLRRMQTAVVELDRSGSSDASRRALLLGGLCFIGFMAEGSALDWSGLLLREYRGMPVQAAGWGYALFAAGMALGRLGGDRAVAGLGAYRALAVSAWLAAAGFFLAMSLPWQASSLLGFALAGSGIANIAPILFTCAGKLPGRSAGSFIAMVSTLGCIGLLSGPALIGLLAHASSLPRAFGLVIGLLLMLGLIARTLRS